MEKENQQSQPLDLSDPIYRFDGEISLQKAVPFGLQHVLAMFVANIAPILIVTGAVKMPTEQAAALIQAAMIMAGVGSLFQMFPVGPLGSRLPIIMGISFTFVSTFCVIGAKYGYGAILGAALVGGCLEGCLGLIARWWRRFIPPIVSASVVTSIGFSLLGIGANSFGGGFGNPHFGEAPYMIVGTVTLFSCLIFNIKAKSFYKQLSVLFGLVVGYVTAFFYGMVDLSKLGTAGVFSLPQPLPYALEFHPDAIFSVFLIFLVSATETLGDTSALTVMGFGRNATDKEIEGSIGVDGFISALSSLFGCLPITSFSQNVGLIAMTHVVNRKAVASGAAIMILAGLFPVLGVDPGLPAGSGAGRLHPDDVRLHCGQRGPDAGQLRLQPAEYDHCRPEPVHRHRIYPKSLHFQDFSGSDEKRLCRKLCGSGVRSGRSAEFHPAGGDEIKELPLGSVLSVNLEVCADAFLWDDGPAEWEK